MAADFNTLIELVLKREGGYVNDPKDRGGETKYGISKRAFPKEDIKNLTTSRAKDLYLKHYWLPARCESVPDHLRDIHFDSAVNHGVRMAIKLLQRAAGIKDDGLFGPKTVEAATRVSLDAYVRERLAYYERIIANDPSQAKFRRGWVSRTLKFLKRP
jgi:lysozyme family protein